MTFIETGLHVRNGFAEGPLADATLFRAARAGSSSTNCRSMHPR
jgi:hypothetical protein